MPDILDATCERCWRAMRWDALPPRVCTACRLAACGLDPAQIEQAAGIPRERPAGSGAAVVTQAGGSYTR